jgi:transposase-like protein
MTLSVEKEGSRFRIKWQGNSIDWLPDTTSNRKAVLVFLRCLRDENDKPVFTHQELSKVVDSQKRQASSGHIERFLECGSDFLRFLTRKRKVDSQVVEAVMQELHDTPLAEANELQQRVNARLGRSDLSWRNIKVALEQIPCQHIRRTLRKQIAEGKAHYQEEELLKEIMSNMSCSDRFSIGLKAGIVAPETACASQGMYVSDPTSIRKLVTPDVPVSAISGSLRWVIFCMALYYHGVSLSVLGKWLKVHKTTILRWVLGLALALWPIVYSWVIERVKARVVYIDEKWLKIRGKWRYWFVVLDTQTGLPVLASLLPTRSKWACRWLGIMLKRIGKIPRVIITDGLLSYGYLMDKAQVPDVKHILCHFHHQQGVTRWLKKHFHDKEEIAARKPKMKRVLQTNDKRTVRRRLQKLKESSGELGICEWVQQTETNLPKLLPCVGSVHIPRTTNAIERFFRAFSRFYKVRCGFFSVVSAKRELILFLLMYLFVQQPESGKAPIESIMPEVREMPLYKMINDPLGTVMGLENVKRNVDMADFALLQTA